MKPFAMAAIFLMVAFSAQGADDGGWRIGAHAAFSDFEGDPTFPVDDSTVGFKLTGQYKFTSWLGLEGAYFNSADFEEDLDPGSSTGEVELSLKGFSIAGVGYIPIPSEEIEIFVKLGYYDFDVDLTGSDLIGPGSDVTVSLGHDDGLTAGAGAAISIAEDFAIRADFDWYDIENSDMWSVGLGVEYRF